MEKSNKSTDDTVFHNYKIVIENDKYGIVDNNGNKIVDTIFDYIQWHTEDELVEFRMKNKDAICHVSDLIDF